MHKCRALYVIESRQDVQKFDSQRHQHFLHSLAESGAHFALSCSLGFPFHEAAQFHALLDRQGQRPLNNVFFVDLIFIKFDINIMPPAGFSTNPDSSIDLCPGNIQFRIMLKTFQYVGHRT